MQNCLVVDSHLGYLIDTKKSHKLFKGYYNDGSYIIWSPTHSVGIFGLFLLRFFKALQNHCKILVPILIF